MTMLDAAFGHRWVTGFATSFEEQRQRLTDLDRLAGDGDFGTNLSSALRRGRARIAETGPASFGEVFAALSYGFLNTGGTSGPLFGMWFRDISRAASTEPADLIMLARGVRDGLGTVQRLGHAEVGDNTMVDAIAPASAALEAEAAAGRDLAPALVIGAEAARYGALRTRDMVAARGRASYVGELARGVLDPGAVAVALFFAAGAGTAGALVGAEDWLSSAN